MIITQRHTEIFTAGILYVNLALSDLILYPRLTVRGSLILSALRFFLLVFPLCIGYFLSRTNFAAGFKIMLFSVWLLFLPYTIYSFTEIRHVAELCRLPAVGYYTEHCLVHTWTLLPIFVYALAGTLIFVFSLLQVTNALFKRSYSKRIAILGICFYSALTGTFGLYSRLNVWHVVSKPKEFAAAVNALPLSNFISNTAITAIFYVVIVFVINRMMRWTNKYIQEPPRVNLEK